MDILNEISLFLTEFITNYKTIGLVICCLLIFVEALLPFLPLSLFVTFIFLLYGKIVGFLVSYLFSVLGTLFLYNILLRIKLKNEKKYISKFKNISLFNLTIFYALPFNSSFLMTLMCSVSKISTKKFIFSVIIGKLFEVYFWGFIGCSFIDSLTNIKCLVKVLLGLLIMYVLTLFLKKKINI